MSAAIAREPPWRRVPVGEVLRRVRTPAVIDPESTYRLVTIRMNHRGVTLRKEVLGKDLGSARWVVRAGQFVLSCIDARHGAFALVPPDLDGAIITNDFWALEVDARLIPAFFDYYAATEEFRAACGRASEGTTNRVRLKVDAFDRIRVPLPPLPEQERIVGKLDEVSGKIEEARTLAKTSIDVRLELYRALLRANLLGTRAVGDVSALLADFEAAHLRWPTSRFNAATPGRGPRLKGPFALPSGWIWAPLGALCTHIVDCVNDTPEFSEEKTAFIGLKTTNIRPNLLAAERVWYLTERDFHSWSRRETLRPRDIVLTREAPMGMVCQVPEGGRFALTQRLMMLRTDERFILPEFLKHMLNDELLMEQARRLSRSSPPHLRVGDVPALAVPITDLATQRRFVDAADRAWDAAGAVACLRQNLPDAIDALDHGILAAAFSGRL